MSDIAAHWEQAKTVLRWHYPDSNFILSCVHCGSTWPEHTEMGMVKTHFQISHDLDAVSLNLVWIGEGPAPEQAFPTARTETL